MINIIVSIISSYKAISIFTDGNGDSYIITL